MDFSKPIDLSIDPKAMKVYQKLTQAGFETYLVGGWVRDHLIRIINREENREENRKEEINSSSEEIITSQELISVSDIDFATRARPEEVAQLFDHTIPTGIKHGTMTVMIEGQGFEVTTFRSDGVYSDSRRPDQIFFSNNLREDLQRRDFTINGFAYDPLKKTIIDQFGGLDDLKNKKIKTIGKAEDRFAEDALRMMRACRFAAQLNFDIEIETVEAIKTTHNKINQISQERIRDELVKLVVGINAIAGINYMKETGLLKIILPELSETIGVTQNKFHAYNVYEHSLEVLKEINLIQYDRIKQSSLSKKTSYQLSLSALFHDIAKPQTKQLGKDGEGTFYGHEILGAKTTTKILKRLKFSNKDVSKVSELVRFHMFHYTDEWKDSTVRRFLNTVGIENFENLFLLRRADRLGKGSVENLEDNNDLVKLQSRVDTLLANKIFLKVTDLEIDGNDLIKEFNLTQGKKVGFLLKKLLELVIEDPEINQYKKLLAYAKKILEKSNSH